jgi:Holliday junction resolvase RusA-like endonuclease
MTTDALVYSRPPDVSVEIDGIPPSKKNGQRIMLRRGRGRFVASSKAAEVFEQHLRLVARRLRSLGANYVATRVTIDERAQRTRIEVWDLGPQPAKGRCDTKRDVHNCADVVMDALQGAVFDDDRQARSVLTCYGAVPAASPLRDPTD